MLEADETPATRAQIVNRRYRLAMFGMRVLHFPRDESAVRVLG
jgi:hypothetical protein